MLTFVGKSPNWVKKWSKWCHTSLVPEWDVSIAMVKAIEGYHSDVPAICSTQNEYLRASISFLKKLEDNYDGRIVIIHEFCHLLLCKFDLASKIFVGLIDSFDSESSMEEDSSTHLSKVGLRAYCYAEEETIARLSKILYNLAISDAVIL